MKTISKIDKMKFTIRAKKSQGNIVGFVPTMGYLHEGHLSLVRASLENADCTVVSIFVNPTQFGPKEDFKDYPRDITRDMRFLEEMGVDFLFLPNEAEMYPPGYRTFVEVENLQDKLCGRSRPGHFRGVGTVVLKLFNIVLPDMAFFGQKDAQQAIILKRMVGDLNMDVRIEVMPIVREKDGLALSSRNIYLNPEERQAALCLSRSLHDAERRIRSGERRTSTLLEGMKEIIDAESLANIDYIAIVDRGSLEPIEEIQNEALIVLAVFIGKIRLIDNVMVSEEE
jgi:pantoate--beta-alanine ligase